MEHTHDGSMDRMRQTTGLINLVAQGVACTGEVFLHSNLGSRATGTRGIVGVVLRMLYIALYHGQGVTLLVYYLYAVIAMLALYRLRAIWRWFRNTPEQEHSRYTGRPHLCRLLPRFVPEIVVKAVIEPTLLFVIAYFGIRAHIDRALGAYLTLVSIALAVTNALGISYERARRNVASMDVPSPRLIHPPPPTCGASSPSTPTSRSRWMYS